MLVRLTTMGGLVAVAILLIAGAKYVLTVGLVTAQVSTTTSTVDCMHDVTRCPLATEANSKTAQLAAASTSTPKKTTPPGTPGVPNTDERDTSDAASAVVPSPVLPAEVPTTTASSTSGVSTSSTNGSTSDASPVDSEPQTNQQYNWNAYFRFLNQ